MRKIILAIISLTIILHGCATTSRITPKLSLGMTKQEVLRKCGNPLQSGALKRENGKMVETFIYKEKIFFTEETSILRGNPLNTYVYFEDGKVVYFGGNPNMPKMENE